MEKLIMNLLENFSRDKLVALSLNWEHAPQKWEALPESGLRIYVPGWLDYFQDPNGVHIKDDAPYLWMNVSGNFVAQVHLRQPPTTSMGDAGALMARLDAHHWGKLCYESTSFGTTAAVSVVTNGVSDDANGADLSLPEVWLQMCRAGDIFGLHYSLDGSSWRMVRLFKLPMLKTIKIGLVAQCPTGPSTTIDFLSFSVEPRTVKDLRAGI
jgi:uncharacterized protein